MLGPVNHPHVEHLALAMRERGLDVTAAGNAEPDLPPSVLPTPASPCWTPHRRCGGRRPAPRRTSAGSAGSTASCAPTWSTPTGCAATRPSRRWPARRRWSRWPGAPTCCARTGSARSRTGSPLRRSRIAMADSQALLDRLVELGARREATVLVNWGVDLDAFAPAQRRRPGAPPAARPGARTGDPQPALADAGLQPRDDPRRVRAGRRDEARRPARAEAHGRRPRGRSRSRRSASTSSATCRTSGWRRTTRRPTSACRSRPRTARRDRSGRRWRAGARWWCRTSRGCAS